MGLGPPVCRGCKLIMNFDSERKAWTCPRCGKDGHAPGVTHLLCLNDQEFAEVEANSEPKKEK